MRSVADIFRSHAVLDADGRHVNGSDKMSNHNYGDAYESLFMYPETSRRFAESSRDDVKLMMEIGVADGSSLLAWLEVFPNATIVGMDIHPAAKVREEHNKKHHTEPSRLEFYLGDQRSKEDCERATASRQFDLIVEDATHQLEDTLRTLYWMWPSVRLGGMYIVEEWPNTDRDRIKSLWPCAEVVDTQGPFGGVESLVVFRKLVR